MQSHELEKGSLGWCQIGVLDRICFFYSRLPLHEAWNGFNKASEVNRPPCGAFHTLCGNVSMHAVASPDDCHAHCPSSSSQTLHLADSASLLHSPLA